MKLFLVKALLNRNKEINKIMENSFLKNSKNVEKIKLYEDNIQEIIKNEIIPFPFLMVEFKENEDVIITKNFYII